MKKIHLVVALFGLLFSACEKNDVINHETNFSAGILLTPQNDTTIVLSKDNSNSVLFSWQKTNVKNGTTAFYKVIFDRMEGDFSNPISEIVPAKLGSEKELKMSRINLDAIAVKIDAKPGIPVKIKWTIVASNGVSNAISDKFRTLTVNIEEQNPVPALLKNADALMNSLVTLYLNGKPRDIWTNNYPFKDGFWDGAAVIWGHGAAFSGYVALKIAAEKYPALKDKYKTNYDDRFLIGIDKFRNKRAGGLEAYAVYPGDTDERYYDDNVWVGLDMIDLYLLTKESKYLDRAKLVWNFILSGTDNTLGGGVYWKENTIGKNTCSTAPAAVLAAKLYQATKEEQYLTSAKNLYQWVKNTLQDPADHLYWDNARLNDPNNPNSGLKIDKAKYSYNSGQPMQAAALLYNITKDVNYLNEAKQIALAAYQKWFIPYRSIPLNESFQILEPGHVWFQSIMLRGYIELFHIDGVDKYVSAYKKTLNHAWASNARNTQTNLLNTDFRGGTSQTSWEILFEGACVEMMARLAILEK